MSGSVDVATCSSYSAPRPRGTYEGTFAPVSLTTKPYRSCGARSRGLYATHVVRPGRCSSRASVTSMTALKSYRIGRPHSHGTANSGMLRMPAPCAPLNESIQLRMMNCTSPAPAGRYSMISRAMADDLAVELLDAERDGGAVLRRQPGDQLQRELGDALGRELAELLFGALAGLADLGQQRSQPARHRHHLSGEARRLEGTLLRALLRRRQRGLLLRLDGADLSVKHVDGSVDVDISHRTCAQRSPRAMHPT